MQFARLLVHQVRLRKALADPGLPPEPKRALLTELGQGRLDEASVELLATVATRQRVRLRDFPGLLASLAAMAAFTAADKAGQLEQLESELFGVATLVEREHGVRSALTNPGLPVENKRALHGRPARAGPAGAPPPWPTCWSSCTRATSWTPWPGSGRRRRRPAATGWWPRCAAPSSSTTSAGPAWPRP